MELKKQKKTVILFFYFFLGREEFQKTNDDEEKRAGCSRRPVPQIQKRGGKRRERRGVGKGKKTNDVSSCVTNV